MARLLFPNGERPPHELRPGRQVLGRIVDCDIVVGISDVSREHAAIFVEDDGSVWVQDLASKNGTLVNGKPIEGRVRLTLGDEVRFGVVDAIFEADMPSSARLAVVAGTTGSPERDGGEQSAEGRAPLPAGRGAEAGEAEAPARPPVAPPPAPRPPASAPLVRMARRRTRTQAALAPILLGIAGVVFAAIAFSVKQDRDRSAAAQDARDRRALARTSAPPSVPPPPTVTERPLPRALPPAPPPLPRPLANARRAPSGEEAGGMPLSLEERTRLAMGPSGAPEPPPARREPPGSGAASAEPVPPVAEAPPPRPPAAPPPLPPDPGATEVDALLRGARAGEAAARATLEKLAIVTLRHDGALGPEAAGRILALVRERLERGRSVRVVPADRLAALRESGLKLDLHEVEVRTSYTQDYAKGYGRLAGKMRLAPHPKTVKVEIVEVSGSGNRPLASCAATTPPLDRAAEEKPEGLTEPAVWSATLEALEKALAAWSGRL